MSVWHVPLYRHAAVGSGFAVGAAVLPYCSPGVVTPGGTSVSSYCGRQWFCGWYRRLTVLQSWCEPGQGGAMNHFVSAAGGERGGRAANRAVQVAHSEADLAVNILLRHPGHLHCGRVVCGPRHTGVRASAEDSSRGCHAGSDRSTRQLGMVFSTNFV